MDIFGQLGINTTAAFQFVLFAIALTFLSKVVFAPYAHALDERQKRTKGGEDLALEYQNKSTQLVGEYESKVRDLNAVIKDTVDTAKNQATKAYEVAIANARTESETLVQENRQKVSSAVQQAAADLKTQVSTVAITITNKLLK